jgi:hypothetical protein
MGNTILNVGELREKSGKNEAVSLVMSAFDKLRLTFKLTYETAPY